MPTWKDVFNPDVISAYSVPEAEESYTPKQELQPPPTRSTGLLPALRSASSWVQENLSPAALERETGDVYIPGLGYPGRWPATAARIAGSVPASAGAAAGSGLGEKFLPPILRSDVGRLPAEEQMKAFKPGFEKGLEEAPKVITALDVASAGPGIVGKVASIADAALGFGDIYGASTDPDLTPGERAAGIGMGAFRAGANIAGLALRPPPTPIKKPGVAEALAGAAADTAPQLQGPEPYLRSAPSSIPKVEVAPQARNAVDFLANQALLAVNETLAKGGFEGQFPGEAPLTPARQVVIGNPPGMTKPVMAAFLRDTIYIGDNGVRYLLQGATDAKGVMDNLVQMIAHEAQHGTEAGIGAQRTMGQLGPGGHAAGVPTDDRLMSFTQQLRDRGIQEAAKSHPLLGDAAAAVERSGWLKDSFLPPNEVALQGATYPVRDLELFHQVMETPAAQRPVVPEHIMRRQQELMAQQPEPTLEPLQMAEKFEPPKPSAIRALTGRQPGHAVTDIVELPATKKLIDYLRAKKEAAPKLPKVSSMEVLAELEKAKQQGRVTDAAQLKALGVEQGDLWPIYNDIDKMIRNKMGGHQSKEGAALWKRVQAVKAISPRAFGQSPRQLGTNPRALRIGPQALKPVPVGGEPTGVKTADQLEMQRARGAEAREKGQQVIKEGMKVPRGEGPEAVTSWADRMRAKVEELKAHLPFLGKKYKRATLDRLAQTERVTLKELRAARKARAAEKAAEGEEPLEMGRGFLSEDEQAKIEAAREKEIALQNAKMMQQLREMPRAEVTPYKGPRLEELPAKGKPLPTTEGLPAKKAAPQPYRSRKALEPLRTRIQQKAPLKGAAAATRADRMANQRVISQLDRTGVVSEGFIEKAGFSPEGKTRAKLALARAKQPRPDGTPRSPEHVELRFRRAMRELEAETLQPTIGEKRRLGEYPKGVTAKEGREKLLQELGERGKQEPLEGEVAKALPEGKMSPFPLRKGAALPRLEKGRTVAVWANQVGDIVEETLQQAGPAAKELKEALGLTVPEKFITPAAAVKPGTTKVVSPSKLVSKFATVKNFLPGVISKLEAAAKRIEAKGADPSKVKSLLGRLKNSEFYQQVVLNPRTMWPIERQTLPATTATGKPRLEKLPPSLEPSRDIAFKTGGRAGMKRLEGLERDAALGKLSVKGQGPMFDIAAKFRERYTGPKKGAAQERVITSARPAPKGVKAPVTFESQRAKTKYVQEEVQAGMEQLRSTIDELGGKGRLWTLEEAQREAAKGGSVPNLLDELSYKGRALDPEGEYYLNKAELKKYEQKLKRRVEEEWEQIQQEGAEGRATARAKARVTQVYEDIKLPTETREFLKGQTTPRLLPEIVKWVDARVTLGDLKPTERAGAIDFLRSRGQAMEHFASRGVSKQQRAQYLGKKAGKVDADLLERAAIQLEADDTTPNPWDDSALEMGKGFTEDEMVSLAEKAKQAGKVKESGAVLRRQQLIENIGETLNITRPLLTAVDVSNPFRQTWQLTTDQIAQDLLKVVRKAPTSDTSFGKNLVNMLKTFGSERQATALTEALHSDSWFKIAKDAGTNFIDDANPHEAWIGKQKLGEFLEAVAKKVPPVGLAKRLIVASERSFSYYQNKVMRDAFKSGMEAINAMQAADPKKFSTGTSDLASFVEHINNAASRGKLTGNPQLNKYINYVFYSGQMNMSRVRMLGDILNGFRTYDNPAVAKYARQQLVRTIAGAVAVNGLIYSVAQLAGEEPKWEKDPRSGDFGKISIGDTTYDGGGGWFQFLRAATQVATGSEKERGTGVIKPKSVGDTIINFVRNKLGPGASTAANVLYGRTVEGEAIDFKRDPVGAASRLTRDLITPMSVDDMSEIVRENPQVSWLIPLMLLGNGVGSNLPSGTKAWRTGDIRTQEQENRKELRERGVYVPTVGTRVTLPGRDTYGRPNYYTLTPAEKEAFQKEYMPLVTKLLNEFIRSEHYQKLPETTKKKALYRRVHELNKNYGIARRGKKEYIKKFREGKVEPSNLEEK